MNRELRKFRKTVNEYVLLLKEHPEDARTNCKHYLSDISTLQNIIEQYINNTADTFQIWCDKSVEVFTYEADNIFARVKKKVNMLIVNHYLNKLSYELSICGIFMTNLQIINTRLVQYDVFT